MTVTGIKTVTAGTSVLRLTRFQRHSNLLDETLLMVVSPTQSAVAATAVVEAAAAAAKVTAAATEALERDGEQWVHRKNLTLTLTLSSRNHIKIEK